MCDVIDCYHLYSDPGAPDAASKKGMLSLSFGKLFEKVCRWISEEACKGKGYCC